MTREELHQMYMADSTEYCNYCCESRGDRLSCCQENHFSTYADMDKDSRKELLDEYEELEQRVEKSNQRREGNP